jgi:hypothetical protein
MFQNTKYSHILLIVLITAVMLAIPGQRILAASTGADFAQATLARANALAAHYSGASNSDQRDNALQVLRKGTSDHLSHLSEADRIDYVEYMAKLAKIDSSDADDLSELAFIFITAGPSAEEMADGNSRLLASDDPRLRETGEGLVMRGSVKLPNGEIGQDISVFDLALHDPKVPQDRLIGALFKVAPVESAQWFADHAGLPANERAGLESDLQNAWKLHRALNDPYADKETKAVLDESVKNPLLDRWLHSPSWILRSMANGLLAKREELQTPDLKKAMQPVQVPAGLQITSTP